MVKMWLFITVVFVLCIITLYSSFVSEERWFKVFISVIFSSLVTMLVTFNIFR